MLHEFLGSNYDELVGICRNKVLKRSGSEAPPIKIDEGIPLFIKQLTETLRREEASPEADLEGVDGTLASTEIGRSASLHGTELLRLGFTVDQVVHDYGDVCQAVTQLALDRGTSLSTEEFRTLNRCLDNAIADAVTAFAQGHSQSKDGENASMRERVAAFSDEHRRLTEIAIQSFSAIKTGNIGATGATGGLLQHALSELTLLAEQILPELRAAPAVEEVPSAPAKRREGADKLH